MRLRANHNEKIAISGASMLAVAAALAPGRLLICIAASRAAMDAAYVPSNTWTGFLYRRQRRLWLDAAMRLLQLFIDYGGRVDPKASSFDESNGGFGGGQIGYNFRSMAIWCLALRPTFKVRASMVRVLALANVSEVTDQNILGTATAHTSLDLVRHRSQPFRGTLFDRTHFCLCYGRFRFWWYKG